MNWLAWNWSTARGKACQCSFLLIKCFRTKGNINWKTKYLFGKNIKQQWKSVVMNLITRQ